MPPSKSNNAKQKQRGLQHVTMQWPCTWELHLSLNSNNSIGCAISINCHYFIARPHWSAQYCGSKNKQYNPCVRRVPKWKSEYWYRWLSYETDISMTSLVLFIARKKPGVGRLHIRNQISGSFLGTTGTRVILSRKQHGQQRFNKESIQTRDNCNAADSLKLVILTV